MSRGKTQRTGIELARKLAPDGLVEVWGLPEDTLRPGETFCTFELQPPPEDFRGVVFHVRAVPITEGWVCLACGSTSEPPSGSA